MRGVYDLSNIAYAWDGYLGLVGIFLQRHGHGRKLHTRIPPFNDRSALKSKFVPYVWDHGCLRIQGSSSAEAASEEGMGMEIVLQAKLKIIINQQAPMRQPCT